MAVTASPCGGCRQWALEFGVERVAFMHNGELLVRRPDELLPDAFEL
jgi:cytidine deaminase